MCQALFKMMVIESYSADAAQPQQMQSKRQKLKEEAEYFTNQNFREVKRVAMNDYDMARENFVNMGEMMMRLIYQVRDYWQLTFR